jgi:hypothetical protein
MPTLLHRHTPFRAVLTSLLAAVAVAGCGDDSTTPEAGTVVLLDVTLAFSQGVTCETGGVSTSFTGTAGTSVTILAEAAASLTPQFTLYASDFSTQLGGSQSIGAGRARLVTTLAESGVHHVTLCEVSGTAGAVRVTVTRPS